jgi:hypothetical protein
MIAIKIWLLGDIDTYLAIALNHDAKNVSIVSPKAIFALILVICSTLYFCTFSNKWKPYFEEFERWPKRKRVIGNIIVWSIVILIFANVFISVELAKSITRG